ncbi:ubiquitin-specific protease ubp15, partial [Linderina pennispora]
MSHIYHGDLGPPPQYEELYSSVPAPASSQNTYAPPPVASQRQQGTQPLARKQFSSAEDRRLLDEYVPLYKGYVEEGHSVYHWEIDDWTGLPSVACSPAFMAAGQEFQIIVHRNDGYAGSHVSLYLMCMPTETDGSVPHLCAYFSLVMSNFADPLSNQKQAFEVRFTPQQIQMGQTEFTNQSRLHTAQYQHSRPIIENNCVRISAYVRVIEDEAGTLWEDVDKADVYPSADPVGSAGTADYPFLNSLLQTYYHMRMLRNDIYAVPTFNKDAKSSIVRAAQEIFQALEVGDGKPISHQILVEVLRNNSIGAVPATHTRDLCGAVRREIADATLDTVAEGMARRLFSGQIRRTVAYPDIPFSETRVDEYFDLALQIEDGGSLSSALDEYCKTKQMRPEDIPGLQPGEQVNALQSICFESFPPVLHIHLNRFKLDHVKRKVVGNPNRFEYPETIDLSEFMPNDAGARKTWTYSLYAVYYYTVRGAGRPVFVSNIAAGPPGKWLWVGEHTVVPIRKYDVLSLDHEPDPVPIARGEPLVPFNKADRVCMLMYIRDDLRDIVINSNESWRLNQALRAR